MIEYKITRFDGGILDDVREESGNGFQLSTHFDNYTNPLRLTPYRDTESDQNTAYKITRFVYANSVLYGYGVASGNSRPAIYKKSGNPISTSWTTDTDNEAGSGTNRNVHAFWHYKDYLYGFIDNRYLWNWGDITGTETFDETHYDLTSFTNVANGIIHPADDICYFGADNTVYKIDGKDAAPASGIALPTNMIITDLEPFGNLLAIACKPKNAGEKSRVFLWDRDSTNTLLTDQVDWGEGDLLYIANLDGRLIGITDYFLNNDTLGLTVDGGKLVIKQAFSEKARTIKELQKTADDTTSFIPNAGGSGDPRTKIIKNNRLYFPVALSEGSDTWRGVAVVDSAGRITADIIQSGATSIEGIFSLGNYWFIAHNADGSVSRTNDTSSFTTTSIYQTQKFTFGDATKQKTFIGASVSFAPLPASGQVVLKYRKNAQTTWTTLFTETTDNAISREITSASGGANVGNFYEIQFRIESTGGAEITSFKVGADVLKGAY